MEDLDGRCRELLQLLRDLPQQHIAVVSHTGEEPQQLECLWTLGPGVVVWQRSFGEVRPFLPRRAVLQKTQEVQRPNFAHW